jgi:hypothetical protein
MSSVDRGCDPQFPGLERGRSGTWLTNRAYQPVMLHAGSIMRPEHESGLGWARSRSMQQCLYASPSDISFYNILVEIRTSTLKHRGLS